MPEACSNPPKGMQGWKMMHEDPAADEPDAPPYQYDEPSPEELGVKSEPSTLWEEVAKLPTPKDLGIDPKPVDRSSRYPEHTHMNHIRLLRCTDKLAAEGFQGKNEKARFTAYLACLLYTSPSPRDS